MIDLDAVETVLVEHVRSGRGGVRALRAAVDEWAIDRKPVDNVLEAAFRRLVERFDLPAVEFHPIVEGWEIDFRFVGTRILVEGSDTARRLRAVLARRAPSESFSARIRLGIRDGSPLRTVTVEENAAPEGVIDHTGVHARDHRGGR